jgi:hypothetical protein
LEVSSFVSFIHEKTEQESLEPLGPEEISNDVARNPVDKNGDGWVYFSSCPRLKLEPFFLDIFEVIKLTHNFGRGRSPLCKSQTGYPFTL